MLSDSRSAFPSFLSQRRRLLSLLVVGGVFFILATVLLLQHPNFRSPVLFHSSQPLIEQETHDETKAQNLRLAHLQEIVKWEKPKDIKIVGLVFYGRKRYVEILECYLRRNLVENGGILDEIVFAAKTEDPTDLAYLSTLLAQNPKYHAEYHHEKGIDFSHMYGACVPGVICVKIDDDVLFIEDGTIRSIVKKKLEHPEYIGVSANLVVNFATAWLHNHFGAVHPYLPDLKPPPFANATPNWRVRDLPAWTGPKDFDITAYEKTITAISHHRWLPVPPEDPQARKTPIARAEPTLGTSGWHTWMVATQQHYSFLYNLQAGQLWRYGFQTWDAMAERVSINLFAISGEDVEAMGPMPAADEQFITMDYPRKTGRAFVIDGHGLAVHFGYASMAKKSESDLRVEGTDVLQRYGLYARENVCVAQV